MTRYWPARPGATPSPAPRARRRATARSPRGARSSTILEGVGFAPEADDRATTARLTRCPLLDAAKEFPDVVCGVHLGIVRGALDEYGADSRRTDLAPFSEPGACRLDLHTQEAPLSAPAETTAPALPAPARSAERSRARAARRLGLLLPAGLALLAGLDAALMLLGLPAPVSADRLPDVHGMLLVLGFVGTLIALERAVALGRRPGSSRRPCSVPGPSRWSHPHPCRSGRRCSWRVRPASSRSTCRCGGGSATTRSWSRRSARSSPSARPRSGSAGSPYRCCCPGWSASWCSPSPGSASSWPGSRWGRRAAPILLGLATALVTAVTASLLWAGSTPALGLALLALVAWLASHDAARRTVRSTGPARFMALGMLGGYLWLGVAGAVWLVAGAVRGGPAYDAVVHAAFLGFTMSMVMAHAPVILPAVLRRPLAYHPAFLVPLALLHASLALRVWVGDALGHPLAWQVGGVANIAALLGFVATAAWSVTRAGRTTGSSR